MKKLLLALLLIAASSAMSEGCDTGCGTFKSKFYYAPQHSSNLPRV